MAGEHLSVEDSYLAAKILLDNADPVLSGVLLSLIHAQGETLNELLGFHKALVESRRSLIVTMPFVDIVGTGGDRSGTLNISTGGALLAAACGIPVLKHGNQAVSSKCGAADVLASLGYKLNLNDEQINSELEKNNFAFCFAPNFYPILGKIAPLRKKLGMPTIFNLLGPLLNPAGRDHLILGVYSQNYVPLVAETLLKLGTVRSLVFHAHGLDELTTMGIINAKLVTKEGINDLVIDPEKFGLKKAVLSDLQGGESLYNAQILQRSLNGIPTGISDSLVLNAGVALYLYGKVNSLHEGIKSAKARITQDGVIKLNKLQQIAARRYQEPLKRKSIKAAVKATEFAVISEIKRASPSAGHIADIGDPVQRARLYISAGAAAISVLTDAGFNGSLDDLRQVSAGLKDTGVPILCKDFMLTPPQIAEAAAAGADAILLIVHILQEKTIEMARFAHAFGLEVLIEVHTVNELTIALEADADIIGVNQRDLDDFTMHPEQFTELIKLIPKDKIKIAESGLKTREQVLEVLALGYDGVLVGEALSRLENPQEFFVEF